MISKKGFTLIEILVALLVASLISIMSFQFLSNSVFLKDRVDESMNNDSNHMNAINIIRLDLLQAVPFIMKDTNGRDLNMSFIGNLDDSLMTFVSLNAADHNQTVSKLRRISYLYQDNELIRLVTLSNNDQVELSRKTLVSGIENLELRFGQELDDSEIEWPSINYNEDLLFPRYIFLSYSIDKIDYKQVFSTFR